jgi:hypothetical protein
MKNRLPLVAILAFINMSFGQVQLFVKKGSLTVGQSTHQAGAVVSLKSTDKVVTTDKTNAKAKKQAQLIELEKNKTYTYKQLEKKLDGKSNFTEAFINAATSQQVAQKSNAGATHRGVGDDPMAFYPLDSMTILADSFSLEVSPNLKLMSDVRLYRVGAIDTLVFSRDYFTFTLTSLEPGAYNWEYRAKVGNGKYTFKNIFFIPNSKDRALFKENLKQYQAELVPFSDDMRALLTEEFLFAHRWVP